MLASETLFDVKKGFTQDKHLLVGVHISAIAAVGHHPKHPTSQFASPSNHMCLQDHGKAQAALPSPCLSDTFQSYFGDASTSDVIVKAGEVKLHCHKIILIAQSALFRAMFQVRQMLCFICCSFYCNICMRAP